MFQDKRSVIAVVDDQTVLPGQEIPVGERKSGFRQFFLPFIFHGQLAERTVVFL